MQEYPHLTRPAGINIYAVTTNDSLLDYPTYRTIMAAGSLPFSEESAPEDINLYNVGENVLFTPERVVLPSVARAHFTAALGGALKLGHRVSTIEPSSDGVWVDNEHFDYVIDATWGHAPIPRQTKDLEIVFEPTLLLYYYGPPDFPAVTLVDGPLCSLYPTETPGVYTLSSVPHTPLGHFATSDDALAARSAVDDGLIATKRALMEEQILQFLPSFTKHFTYIGPQLSIKTKYKYGAHDDRSCAVLQSGNIISIMSGKIDCIFFAADRVLDIVSKGLNRAQDALEESSPVLDAASEEEWSSVRGGLKPTGEDYPAEAGAGPRHGSEREQEASLRW